MSADLVLLSFIFRHLNKRLARWTGYQGADEEEGAEEEEGGGDAQPRSSVMAVS